MTNIYHQLNIRVRADLMQALKQKAKANRRTMQGEHETMLIEYLSVLPAPNQPTTHINNLTGEFK
jgi:hypothetical protein